MTKELQEIFTSLKAKQKELGIKSEWVFCKESGEWITVQGYIASLRKMCRKLEIPITNNHAFRMSYNSYVLVKKGMVASERARILGHSVEMNLRNYTYPLSDDHLDELRDIIDGNTDKSPEIKHLKRLVPRSTSLKTAVLKVNKKEKNPSNR